MTKTAQRSRWFAALGILLGISASAHAQEPERCASAVARLVSAQGNVDVQGRGEESWTPVSQDAKLCAGDTVSVRKSSRAVVRLEQEQTNVQLGEHSTLIVPVAVEAGYSVVELLKGIGHFISRVPRALNVKTPFVNAAVEGTEFVVKVNDTQALVAVAEGRVNASNDHGTLLARGGENVVAPAGDAPRTITVEDPMEIVQWALYYPQIIDFERYDFARTVAEGWRPAAADSVSAFRQGDLKRALELLNEVPDDARDVRLLVYRATVLLAVGRVTEAKENLRIAAEIQSDHSDVIATQAVIAAVQNQRETALTLAQKAVAAAPDSAATLLAMSYAQQIRFDLDAALFVTQTAVKKDENNALAWARLAEIWLMHGELEQAEIAVKWSLKYNARSPQAHTVRGYAALLRGDFKLALDEFADAARTDQAAPLARLGLGLARIRLGDLPGGRADMEIATSLDPRNSLLRSYVGKAYFDEKRDVVAEDQYAFAKTLDPNDPTPWFYDALLKQAQNRPVEALQNLQKSIDLNDNRAVYRSRLLLDEDRAARSANLARLYTELGFDQLALVEGYQAVNTDPSNYSAHRFLADVYAGLPRHEIARVSELLQAQLLQPLSQNPVQPELAESDMAVLNGSNVLSGGLNEYSSLLMRGGVSARIGLLGASNDTFAEELALSYLGDHSAASVGQFHFETDGFRENADYTRDVYSGFYQVAMGPFTSAQFEVRTSQMERGDIALRFNPDTFFPEDRETVDTHTQRIGIRHQFDSASDLLVSVVRQRREEVLTQLRESEFASLHATVVQSDLAYVSELQYLDRSDSDDVIAGLTYVDNNGENTIDTDVSLGGVPFLSDHNETPTNVTHNSAYWYWNIHPDDQFSATLGITYDLFDGSEVRRYKFNPKLGVIWGPTPNTTYRVAAFRTLKRVLVGDQTLEPVQIAGFNQYFDDDNATVAWRYGIGLDHRVSRNVHLGIEAARRELEVPVLVTDDNEEQSELAHRAYFYWTPSSGVAFGTEYFFEKFQREQIPDDPELPRDLSTQRLPLTLHLSGPFGWSLQFGATGVRQRAVFAEYDEEAVLLGLNSEVHTFWLADISFGYRFNKGSGLASLSINNLFDRSFGYEDNNFRSEPRIPLFYPERTTALRLSLRF